uniref:Prolyl 3-hydroxylase 3 isoform X1 n=1 Tax=Sus scrofa TaxID=9823 RepID=A0A480HTV7_PIG
MESSVCPRASTPSAGSGLAPWASPCSVLRVQGCTALGIPEMVGVQGQGARCSAPVTWGLLLGPGTKADPPRGTSPRSWLGPSQLLSDPRRLPSLVLGPLKPAAGGFWGRVSAGHFFPLLLWHLQQLFGFCPLLLPVLRCPRVPQGQGTAPSPRHGPNAMGILPTRAEGHEASAARTHLSRDGEGIGLCEEQVPALEVIVEVEESTVIPIGVGWGLPPALPSVGVQDAVVRVHRVAQVHALRLLSFYGAAAHQVGEGEMQGPLRGEVGLCQGPHALAHLQEQLSTLTAHRPSSGQLRSLEHREPLEAFVGGVWRAAASIARPGASLGCILGQLQQHPTLSWGEQPIQHRSL